MFHVEGFVDELRVPDRHDAAGELRLQVGDIDLQEVGGEVKTIRVLRFGNFHAFFN